MINLIQNSKQQQATTLTQQTILASTTTVLLSTFSHVKLSQIIHNPCITSHLASDPSHVHMEQARYSTQLMFGIGHATITRIQSLGGHATTKDEDDDRHLTYAASLKNAMRSAPSISFLKPAKNILVPGMYFWGVAKYSNMCP